jgi:hypothetical protein
VVSVGVGGPQESSEGSAETISDSDIGAMVAMFCGVDGNFEGDREFRDCGRTFGGARTSLSF